MIRVFLVDDHAVLRAGLRRLLEDEGDFEVVGEAGGGVEAMSKLATAECDVVVLDLSLPGRSGFDVLQEVLAKRPGLRVLVLSVYPEAQYAARLLRAGAMGYLSKGRGSDEVVRAIRTIAAGDRYLTKTAAEGVEALESRRGQLPHETLSEREADVFRRIAEGVSPTDIAAEMKLSASTVSTYVARIKDKLEVASLSEIVQYAYRHHLVE